MQALLRPALDSILVKLTRFIVLKPMFFLPTDRRIRAERWLRGREQAKKLARADCVVVSFGKSGRTWLRVMLSRFYQLRHGLAERHLLGFDNLHLRNHAIPRIFFTHDNYTKDYTGHVDSKADYYDKKVVLLVRHPADVAVSQYQQWRHRMRPNKKTLNAYPEHDETVSLAEFVIERPAGLRRVIDFMNGWAREMPRLPQLLVVRYEDLRARPEATLGELLTFMGTPGTQDEVRAAVEFASFENMQRLEARRTFWLSGGHMLPRDRNNPQSFKVRRGKVGGYRDDFTAAEIRRIEAAIQAELDPVFGYGDASQPAHAASA
jgi:Sulfotransferase domain